MNVTQPKKLMLNTISISRMALLLVISIANPCLAATLNKQDFAFGMDFTAEANKLYEFPLPEDIYKNIQYRSLSDFRIFAADGSLMPYVIIKQAPIDISKQKKIRQVTAFPVQQMPSQPITDLNLFVKRDHEGTIVNINSSDKTNSQDKGTFYIVDLGKRLDPDIASLQFDWNKNESGQATIAIESSTDLSNWKQAGTGAIVHLSHNQQTLTRNEIPINRLSRYLKVYAKNDNKWNLLKLRTVSDKRIQRRKTLSWTSLKTIKNHPNRFIYELGGYFPLNSIRVTPKKPTTIYQASITSGNDPAKLESSHFNGTIFNMLVNDTELTSDPISINNHFSPLWQVQIFDKDNDNHQPPEFKVSWYPHIVRFLSDQAGNYTVAYGNASLKHHGTSLPSNLNNKSTNPLVAKLNQPYILGGEDKIKAPSKPISYTKPILWSILVLVLVVMGYMAVRLTKHMKT